MKYSERTTTPPLVGADGQLLPPSFVFYRSFLEAIEEASDDQQLQLYKAIAGYALNRTEPQLKGLVKALWLAFKPQLDANYQRWLNSLKGGPKPTAENRAATELQPNCNQTTTEPRPNCNRAATELQPNVNVNENVNENVNDNDNENGDGKPVASSRVGDFDNDRLLDEFFSENNRGQVEQLAMSLSVTPEEFQRLADEVIGEWKLTKQTHQNYSDAAKHLVSQIRIKIRERQKSRNDATDDLNTPQGRAVDAMRVIARLKAKEESYQEPPW